MKENYLVFFMVFLVLFVTIAYALSLNDVTKGGSIFDTLRNFFSRFFKSGTSCGCTYNEQRNCGSQGCSGTGTFIRYDIRGTWSTANNRCEWDSTCNQNWRDDCSTCSDGATTTTLGTTTTISGGNCCCNGVGGASNCNPNCCDYCKDDCRWHYSWCNDDGTCCRGCGSVNPNAPSSCTGGDCSTQPDCYCNEEIYDCSKTCHFNRYVPLVPGQYLGCSSTHTVSAKSLPCHGRPCSAVVTCPSGTIECGGNNLDNDQQCRESCGDQSAVVVIRDGVIEGCSNPCKISICCKQGQPPTTTTRPTMTTRTTTSSTTSITTSTTISSTTLSTTQTTTSTTHATTTISPPGLCPCYPGESFYTGQYYYVFFWNCNDLVYKTSTNGLVWSQTKVAVPKYTLHAPPDFSVYYDGTYVYLAYIQVASSQIYFKKGSINLDQVTWEQEKAVTNWNVAGSRIKLVADSNGKSWISANIQSNTQKLFYNSNRDGSGTWVSWLLSDSDKKPDVTPLKDGRVFVTYFKDNQIKGRIYNSSGPVAIEETVTRDIPKFSNNPYQASSSALASNENNSYYTWLNQVNTIKTLKRTGLSTIELLVDSEQATDSYPDVTSNRLGVEYYNFWFNPENKIKMKIVNSTSQVTDSQEPFGEYFNQPERWTLRTFTHVMNDEIGGTWCEKKSQKPYVYQYGQDEVLVFNETLIKTLICTDSDGGKNYYVKGTVHGVWPGYENNGPEFENDGCCINCYNKPPTVVHSSDNLVEVYCNEENKIAYEIYNCPSGYECEDGACKEITTTSFTTTTIVPTGVTTTQTTTIPGTTTTLPGQFTSSSFTCSMVSGGYSCLITYNNQLTENVIVVFLFADNQGKVVSSASPFAGIGSGEAGANLYCSSVSSGTYQVSWKAYRQSDSTLSDELAWSKTNEIKEIICPLNEKEQGCIDSDGTVSVGMCCKSSGDFPNTCLVGACGCSIENSHLVKVCNCNSNKCFNGNSCQ